MPRNRVQHQKGLSDDAFERLYPDEEACRRAWFAWRWPEGFKCPRCTVTKYCGIRERQLLQSSATAANGFAALPSSRASSTSVTSPALIAPPRDILPST